MKTPPTTTETADLMTSLGLADLTGDVRATVEGAVRFLSELGDVVSVPGLRAHFRAAIAADKGRTSDFAKACSAANKAALAALKGR